MKPSRPLLSAPAPSEDGDRVSQEIVREAAPGRRFVSRFVSLTAGIAALAVGVIAARSHWVDPAEVAPRGHATPTLKKTASGQNIRWTKDAVDLVVDSSFSGIGGDDAFAAAVNEWRVSGALLPSISTAPGDGRSVGYDPDGPNENVVVYAPDGWSKARGALGITVLSYEDATGKIVDGDILINGGARQFAKFDHDESDPNSDPVSIETSGTSGDDGSDGHTSKFDLQSVVTHEIGHFFGLGEDYDDSTTTMYYKTRAGEIQKRLITQSDADVISGLYADGATDASSSPGGCGRAQLAKGGVPASSWIGFAAATVGLVLLGMSRRLGAARARVRAVAPRARRVRRLSRFGGWLTLLGAGIFLFPPTLEAGADVQRSGDADVQIVHSAPRLNKGIIETELTFHVVACHVASCPESDQHVVVEGGSLNGITQVVGPYAVPAVGARVRVSLRDHRGLMQMLHPTIHP